MRQVINPSSITPPFGHYDHGILAESAGRYLSISGQVGVDADGNTPPDVEGQVECVWQNIEAVLAEAGFSTADIVKTTTYLLDRSHVPVLGAARVRHLGEGHKATSTTVIVSGLVRPEWLVEIDAIAVA